MACATRSNDRAGMNRRLFGHGDYGRAVMGTRPWEEINDPVSGATYDDIVIMHGHSTGMYFAQRDKINVLTLPSGSFSVSSIFEMTDITTLNSTLVSPEPKDNSGFSRTASKDLFVYTA